MIVTRVRNAGNHNTSIMVLWLSKSSTCVVRVLAKNRIHVGGLNKQCLMKS